MKDSVAKICSVEDCERKHAAKGLCKAHWQQQKRNGKVGKISRQESFDLICYLDFCNKKTSRMGLCQQHYRRKSEGKTDWQLPLEKRIKSDDSCAVANCDRKVISRGLCRPHYRLKGRFNLSDNKIAELYLNPICSICGIPESPEFKMHAVDHNHSCCPARSGCEKCVRGLLCNNCNRAIGLFEDDPIRLQAAINYLSKYNLTNG